MLENQRDKVVTLSDSFNKERDLIHRQMMSSVSHDLRTPLASIIGSLEIHDQMKNQLTPEKKQSLLSTALQEAYRLDNFINNILDMAKLENKQVKVKRELCDIEQVVRDCLSIMTPQLKNSEVTVHPLSGILTATTDPMLLQRAIRILLDNAVKYGGKPSVISIEYGRGDFAMCCVTVRDYGPGIPGIRTDDIFCKYTRIVKQDTQNAGTGLGLAICREIMHLLEGSVTVENHSDGGAIFILKFPVG